MPRVTTEALVLHRVAFGESSQVAEFLTRDQGRLSLILKGVFRPRDRKGGGVDLLDHCRVTYTRRRGSRSLPQLVERRVLGHHPRLRQRLDLLLAGEALVELLRALAPEGQPHRALFDLSLAYLAALQAQPAPPQLPAVVFALQAGILRLTGFEPVLDRCVVCERRPDGPRPVRCDPERGGVVCSACRQGADRSYVLTPPAVAAIVSLTGADPREVGGLVLPPGIERQMQQHFDRFLLHVLERPSRCHVLHGRTA